MGIVMRHEARQVPSWLIFDVSQGEHMRILLLLSAMFIGGSAFAANVVKPEPNQRFRALVQGADTLFVQTAGLHPYDFPRQSKVLEVFGVSEVEKVAGLFSFSGEYTSVSRFKQNGEDMLAILNCLCTGSHIVTFIREGSVVLSMSIHHWSHVRPFSGWKSQDINLTKQSGESVRGFILSANKEKTANKAPEPTPGSVTPRATEGVSK